MNETEFYKLLEKYQQGTLSEKEKGLIDSWFAALGNDADRVDWTGFDKQRLKRKIISEIEEKDREVLADEDAANENKTGWKVFRMAASVLLLSVLSYVVWQTVGTGIRADNVKVISQNATDVRKMVLEDGSLVWLKGSSTLSCPETFAGATRRVRLSGEALFEVAKDPTRPFIIECGDLTTTVLGTSFNIRADSGDVEVLVLTGQVSLTSKTDKEGIVVMPNEKAVYLAEKKQIAKIERPVNKNEAVAIVSGTEYPMNFEDTRIGEVIHRIERKYDVVIESENPGLANCMITADFTDQSLDATLDMIAQVLALEYRIEGRKITINGAGCF